MKTIWKKFKNNVFCILVLEPPKEIESIVWNDEKKSWDAKKIQIEEYSKKIKPIKLKKDRS